MQHELIKRYCRPALENGSLSSFETAVIHYLDSRTPVPFKYAEEFPVREEDPVRRIHHWRRLFRLVLFDYLRNEKEGPAVDFWYRLASTSYFRVHALEKAYALVCALLLEIPLENDRIVSGKEGTVAADGGPYWNFMQTPFLEWQAEWGTLAVIIGKLLRDPDYLSSARRLGKWMTGVLDFRGLPYRGSWSYDREGAYPSTLLRQSLFFSFLSRACGDAKLSFLSKRQYKELLDLPDTSLKGLPAEGFLLIRWADRLFTSEVTPEEIRSEESSIGSELAYASVRKKDFSVLASLIGCNSGMGCFASRENELIAFGLQLSPVGEGTLFGCMGQNILKEHTFESIKVNGDGDTFSLRGCVAMPESRGDFSVVRRWQYPQDRFDVRMQYEKERLTVEVTPLSLSEETYFSFYVFTPRCLVNGKQEIERGSLLSYREESRPVALTGETESLVIDPVHAPGMMKIIPLEGKECFWGANFLLAYPLTRKAVPFQWKISFINT